MPKEHLFKAPAIKRPKAQRDDPAPVATVASSEAELSDIVVTARRREETLHTVPVSVQAFSAQALQQRGVQDLKDLSSTVAGPRFGSEDGKKGPSCRCAAFRGSVRRIERPEPAGLRDRQRPPRPVPAKLPTEHGISG